MSCAVSCHVYISLNALLRRDDVMIMLCDVKLIVFVNGAEMDAVLNIWKHSKHEETFLFLIFILHTTNSQLCYASIWEVQLQDNVPPFKYFDLAKICFRCMIVNIF